ncbi:MAG: phosphatidate cytidylyltransferase [Verrucomicrobia subdivision 3 bacterium]|nr:phosphatidate cytidylyltransferase [Limisphaerales bacterium]
MEPEVAPAKTSSKMQTFWRRLISSTVLWSLVIGALFTEKLFSDVVFIIVMLLIAGFGLDEFYALCQKRSLVTFKVWGMFAGLGMMLSTWLYLSGYLVATKSPTQANSFETSILIVFVLGLCLRQFISRSNTMGIVAISTTLFGLMYVPWLLNFFQKINYYPFEHQKSGHFYLLYFIAITKFSDLGAYVVGSLIGKHKMIPRISPGKTWEGFGGAIFTSTLLSVLFVRFGSEYFQGMTYFHAIVLGVLLSAAAVVGDLIESLFKREAGVKDSGRFFPGIGGMLDLMDSLLFNAPLMYLYIRHILAPYPPS